MQQAAQAKKGALQQEVMIGAYYELLNNICEKSVKNAKQIFMAWQLQYNAFVTVNRVIVSKSEASRLKTSEDEIDKMTCGQILLHLLGVSKSTYANKRNLFKFAVDYPYVMNLSINTTDIINNLQMLRTILLEDKDGELYKLWTLKSDPSNPSNKKPAGLKGACIKYSRSEVAAILESQYKDKEDLQMTIMKRVRSVSAPKDAMTVEDGEVEAIEGIGPLKITREDVISLRKEVSMSDNVFSIVLAMWNPHGIQQHLKMLVFDVSNYRLHLSNALERTSLFPDMNKTRLFTTVDGELQFNWILFEVLKNNHYSLVLVDVSSSQDKFLIYSINSINDRSTNDLQEVLDYCKERYKYETNNAGKVGFECRTIHVPEQEEGWSCGTRALINASIIKKCIEDKVDFGSNVSIGYDHACIPDAIQIMKGNFNTYFEKFAPAKPPMIPKILSKADQMTDLRALGDTVKRGAEKSSTPIKPPKNKKNSQEERPVKKRRLE
ncbi:hypothetical protein AKO1_015033 [Acrasis kona]|uniref:Transposase n=1 Tax=Acrasis kona TaxID=1008807 RepID=A0AAW2YN71_9EUKA